MFLLHWQLEEFLLPAAVVGSGGGEGEGERGGGGVGGNVILDELFKYEQENENSRKPHTNIFDLCFTMLLHFLKATNDPTDDTHILVVGLCEKQIDKFQDMDMFLKKNCPN